MPALGPSDLAVVIPTRDRWPLLARTLAALSRQSVAGFETIVVVDGTDQRPPDLGPARVVVKDRGGPGAARNAGVAATDRSLLLFLGDDMVPTTQLVEHHLDRHRSNPSDRSAVLGKVEWHPEVARGRLMRWLEWSDTQFDFRNIDGDEPGFGRFYSCNVSLRRRLFLDAGGFDEDFVFDYEDLDLAWRLQERGMRLIYEPAALALHVHGYDWSALERRFATRAVGERLMAAKHPWFSPFYASRIHHAEGEPRVSRIWPSLVGRLPPGPLRRVAHARADRWYFSRLARPFLDAWEAGRELDELREYLGGSYDPLQLADHRGVVEREEASIGDEATFYRSSHGYLYDLTAFAMSGTKSPYLADLRRVVPTGSRVLDYGCGIGSDGLRLLDAGYRVSFADFDNPSTRYLRWRLDRRGMVAYVHDLDAAPVPDGFDAAFAFDVIEHVDDPFEFLAHLERAARIVVVNLLEPIADDTHLHRPLPIASLIEHAVGKGLVRYRIYHGRSHLLIYRADGAGAGLGRARSALEHRVGRWRRRVTSPPA